jgi:hypothetical protein
MIVSGTGIPVSHGLKSLPPAPLLNGVVGWTIQAARPHSYRTENSMREYSFAGLLTLVAVVSSAIADEPKKPDSNAEHKLVGTWKLVSAKYNGKDVKLPEGDRRLKHVTLTQFTWLIAGKDGAVSTAMGGSCKVSGSNYEETPEYGTSDIFKSFKGKTLTFEWKVEGNKWYHKGKLGDAFEIEEVWERVEAK